MNDLRALENTAARRVKQAIERFAETGAGNVLKLRGINPPEYRLRVGDWRVRFTLHNDALRILRVLNRRDAYR